MKYSELVEVYSELEKTTKRLEKTDIIAKLLRKAKPEELHELVLLLQGRVFPDYDESKIGVATKLVARAIASSAGVNQAAVENEWKKTGDLGSAAQNLLSRKKQVTLAASELTINKVFTNIRKLTEVTGAGSVERKLSFVAELLSSAKPAEARYIVRTILEVLRVGAGRGVLRDAIVLAFFPESKDDREKQKELTNAVQNAYDLTSDFGAVAEKASKGGLKSLGAVELQFGKPIKVMLAQKADTIEEAFEFVGKPAEIEYKYDGFRCISGFTPIYVLDKGLISVKDVKVGDKVLTHKGNFKKVIAVNIRVIDDNEKLFKVHTFLGNEFRITEKHPLLVKGNSVKWIVPERLSKLDKLLFPLPNLKFNSILGRKMVLQDESGYTKSIPISPKFFRFLGYWIGDGYTNDYHNTERIGLIFNAKTQRKLCDFYEKIVRELFGISSIKRNLHGGAIYLYWRDRPFRIWLSKNFRREWKGKMLPKWFFGIRKEQFYEFLKGWIESDGHQNPERSTSITTKERDLAMVAQLLGLKFKVLIGLKKFRVSNKTYYKMILPKGNRYAQINKGFVEIKPLRIVEIKRPDPRTRLYNLQVEGDESYCTSMAALHNCQIHKKGDRIIIYTRNLDNVTAQFPEVVKYVKENVKGKSFILDSEAVGFDPKTRHYLPFQNVSQRIKRKYDIEKMSQDFPVEVNVFDVIEYEGESMINEPFRKRHALIKKIIIPKPRKIVPARSIVTDNKSEVERFFKQSREDGNEGIMFKNLDAPYQPGARVGYMIKFKQAMESLDLVIIGAEWGEGKRSSWLSSFQLACRDRDKFLEIGKVSTGLKEKPEEGLSFEEMTKLLKPLIIEEKGKIATIKPKIVLEVSFDEIQKSPTYTSGYGLRFPRVIRLRPDRSPSDASTIKDIEKAYKGQRFK